MSAVEEPDSAPVEIDPTRVSQARVYDYLLGGTENYEVDREQARALEAAVPDVAEIARENRAFVTRAARYLARRTGILQYLDVGSGLPTAENTHEIVQRVDPEATVVYVDHDPVVLAHGRALLAENDRTHMVGGDAWHPSAILHDPQVRAALDFARPIGLLCTATLHMYSGDDRDMPVRVMREYLDALPSGSYVVLSHLYDPEEQGESAAMRALEHAARTGGLGSGGARTHAEIAAMLDGLELLEPGIVETYRWWPSGPRMTPIGVAQRLVAGAVGRKP